MSIQCNRKKWVCNPRAILIDGNAEVPALTIGGTYKYLGARIGANGAQHSPHEQLQEALTNITKAPLKPQQRLYILRTHLLPKLTHQLVLSTLKSGRLKYLDLIVRGAIWQWLKLKIKLPKSLLYAPTREGGLGNPCLQYTIPAMRHNRTCRLMTYKDPLTAVILPPDEIVSAPMIAGEPVDSTVRAGQIHADRAHSCTDGKGLQYHRGVPAAHDWVAAPTRLLSGKDYIRINHLRHNRMLSRSMKSRLNRNTDPMCPVCVNQVHTVAHVLQQCPRTHGARIRRHDAICKFLSDRFKAKHFQVLWEPHFRLSSGLLKPDLICYNNEVAFVVDISIVSDSVDPDTVHRQKVAKYGVPELLSKVRAATGLDIVIPSALILNWRGAISPASASSLKDVIRKADQTILSCRTLQYGVYIWDTWHKSTAIEFVDLAEGENELG